MEKREMLLRLMETKEFSDVTIEVGKEKEIFSTHKILLSTHSKHFYSMFSEPEKMISEIRLPDDDSEVFEVFLKFIYTGKLKLKSVNEAISSFCFANKYAVKFMRRKCLHYIKKSINSANVLEIYEKASELQETDIETECMTFINCNSSKVINNDSIKYVRYETMLKLVSEDHLILDSEIDMYNAVMKWGKEKYPDHTPDQLRENLNPLLLKVRFLSMSLSEFIEGPCQDKIFTISEECAILKEISSKYKSDIVQDEWRTPRKTKPNEWFSFYAICRNCSDNDGEFPFVMNFRCKKSVYVTGLRFICRCTALDGSGLKWNSLLEIKNLNSEESVKCKRSVIMRNNDRHILIKTKNSILVNQNEIVRFQLKFTQGIDSEDVKLPNDFKILGGSLLISKEENVTIPLITSFMNDYVNNLTLCNQNDSLYES